MINEAISPQVDPKNAAGHAVEYLQEMAAPQLNAFLNAPKGGVVGGNQSISMMAEKVSASGEIIYKTDEASRLNAASAVENRKGNLSLMVRGIVAQPKIYEPSAQAGKMASQNTGWTNK